MSPGGGFLATRPHIGLSVPSWPWHPAAAMVVTEGGPRIDSFSPPRRSRVPRGLFYLLVGGVAVWALTLSLTNHPSKSPVYAALPTGPAHVSVVHGICHGTDGLGDPNPHRDQVWVDAAPSGAVAMWLPAWNDRPCVSVLTGLNATNARELAAAVRAARPPRGDISGGGPAGGPGGQGSVTIFFTYPGKARAEVVRVFFGVYGGLTAPGRDTRVFPDSGEVALRPAPQSWKQYTGG